MAMNNYYEMISGIRGLHSQSITSNFHFQTHEDDLIYLLVLADKENGSFAPCAYWPKFYANFIISRYT